MYGLFTLRNETIERWWGLSEGKTQKYELAFADYRQGMKYKDIADKYEVSLSAVKSWATRYWKKDNCNQENKKLQPKKKKVATRGGQPGNKNAVGHGGTGPPGNKNAEKYGFFSKYLPDETREIFNAIEEANPLDLLWHQIQIAYAAIIRAQSIMYVKDKDDKTNEVQAWDKQANFLKAQARAQAELRSLIKQYDEMLHKNWELATEEQKTRIDIMRIKAQIDDDSDNMPDDGFIEALNGKAAEDWSDEEN